LDIGLNFGKQPLPVNLHAFVPEDPENQIGFAFFRPDIHGLGTLHVENAVGVLSVNVDGYGRSGHHMQRPRDESGQFFAMTHDGFTTFDDLALNDSLAVFRE
jgi:hypothetical protein